MIVKLAARGAGRVHQVDIAVHLIAHVMVDVDQDARVGPGVGVRADPALAQLLGVLFAQAVEAAVVADENDVRQDLGQGDRKSVV